VFWEKKKGRLKSLSPHDVAAMVADMKLRYEAP